MKKYLIFLLFSALLISACQTSQTQSGSNLNLPAKPAVNSGDNDGAVNNSEEKSLDSSLPKQVNLPVEFESQAPLGNWDDLHDEACEEASMIMAAKYLKKEPVNQHTMEQAILNAVKWQENQGYGHDLTAEQTVTVLSEYFGVNSELVREVTVERIKQELAQGKVIIIPAAGRELENPNFTQPGPLYHMLLIRGYDDNKKEFITNDPGTRNGENFRYKYQKLISAIHDWNPDFNKDTLTEEEMRSTPQVMVVVTGLKP